MFNRARLTRPLLPLLVLLLAFALRSYRLDAQSLRGDEAASVLYAAMPLGELWELSRITDPHPPLFYALLHPWQWLLGDSAWVMRFAGVIAGTLAVAALYRLARVTLAPPGLRRSPVALLAMTLLAVNPLQIWLAQDIRSYPLFTLLGLLSSWALWAALRVAGGQGRRGAGAQTNPRPAIHNSPFTVYHSQFFPWLLYILLTVASLYTHYYTAFLIAFQGLWVLLNARRFWPSRWPWLASQVAIGLLILPGLLLAANFIGGEAGGGVAVVGLAEIVQRTAAALLTGFTLDAAPALWLSLLLLPVWLAGLAHLLRRDVVSGSFWALFFAIPTLGVIALAIDRPFFKERFLIQAQPAFLLLLAAGFVAIYDLRFTIYENSIRRSTDPLQTRHTPHATRFTFYVLRFFAATALVILLAANLAAIANYHTDPAYAKAPPWRLYHDFVAGHAKAGDVMLTNFPEAAISYYSPNGLPFYVVPAERGHTAAELADQTAQIAGAYRRIWFLPMLQEGFDERGDVLNWLDRHTDRVDQIFFPVFNLNLYLAPAAIAEAMLPQPAAFNHGISLRGYQIFDKRGKSRLAVDAAAPLLTLEPDDEFTLSLYWQADAPPGESYTVFVHLIAADGFTRTSQDNLPVWGSYPTHQWQPGEQVVDRYTLTLPPGTPPGDHRLRVGWYNSATGERVTLPNGADHLLLDAVVRVEE
ncbi:MAG: hypothetical protein Kow0031_31050 [Anaerolineae bacterium]